MVAVHAAAVHSTSTVLVVVAPVSRGSLKRALWKLSGPNFAVVDNFFLNFMVSAKKDDACDGVVSTRKGRHRDSCCSTWCVSPHSALETETSQSRNLRSFLSEAKISLFCIHD